MRPGQVRFFDADEVRGHLDAGALVEALRGAFAEERPVEVPDRLVVPIEQDAGSALLLKPAWRRGGRLGVKVATHHPGNGSLGLPAIQALYTVHDTGTGRPLAVLDGTELTRWRTAAASALAADLLAPAQVDEHLLVGAGNIAAALPACYATVRRVGTTRVWARRPEQARDLAARLRAEGHDARPVEGGAEALRAAVSSADVVSAATSATRPLVLGADVRPGTHVDLIGSFTPRMVEADEDLVARARVYVDVEAAVREAGELAGPVRRGVIGPDHVRGTLADLVAGRSAGRGSAAEVTVFKAVGTALEDLVAAEVVLERAGD